ncbi:MAG TPA: sulfite exporter TauE/SafE family protein [Candidatus Scybalocola faecigallinarum]|uniref:Probable membrane transporter protein n=1 Tax=Candidatus Scybalocola faecigallinarum TaxID=2840941 RepID=A0A9D1JRP3_9FIRM|nr:sulfite exporter TauE/SafE family protein [Candidatus Scybalocola faecigallinarum]
MGLVYVIFFAVSFGASIIGAICGIGGGVIIKPVLDAFGVLSVSTIGFLSGCTVLVMSCYSVVRSKMSKSSAIDMAVGTPLAIGAAVGGVAGKSLYQWVESLFVDPNTAGAVQAITLGIITLGTLIYTVEKDKIKTYRIKNVAVCLIIGLVLGIMSSFLGIGGGPINLVVLYFFFSMTTKTAAQNSLYIILFSQATSFLQTVITGLPEFSWLLLAGMIAAGLLGGMCGRAINKKIDDKVVDKLFIALMVVIILINIYNVVKYLG